MMSLIDRVTRVYGLLRCGENASDWLRVKLVVCRFPLLNADWSNVLAKASGSDVISWSLPPTRWRPCHVTTSRLHHDRHTSRVSKCLSIYLLTYLLISGRSRNSVIGVQEVIAM